MPGILMRPHVPWTLENPNRVQIRTRPTFIFHRNRSSPGGLKLRLTVTSSIDLKQKAIAEHDIFVNGIVPALGNDRAVLSPTRIMKFSQQNSVAEDIHIRRKPT